MNQATSANPNLAAFVTRVEPQGPAGRRDALREEFAAQGGNPNLPPDTTDGYHIALFGLQACGINEDDAVRQWICIARTLLGGFPKPSHDPNLRMPQILWAMHILGQWQTIPAHHLKSACQIVLTLSSNPTLIARAREVASACNFTTTAA